MVTQGTRSFFFVGLLSFGLWNCQGAAVTGGGGNVEPTAPDNGVAHYPGTGFVVHEWGTDTVVVGSDGSLQRGLHHEEEDLPGFVYDRMKAGMLEGSASVAVKMETPVTYFYSNVPRTVGVTVDFPKGIFTQWYPAVMDFSPPIAAPNSIFGLATYTDPVFDLAFPFTMPFCIEKYSAIANGRLNWGNIEVLDPSASTANLPEASIDSYTWEYARNVQSNPVRIANAPGALLQAQDEKFLFYRGLGNFELPINVAAPSGTTISLANTYPEAIGTAFVIRVGDGKGAFVEQEQGIGAMSSIMTTIPSLDGAADMSVFTNDLGTAVTRALDQTGLYHDEALAMVDTWKRQWFGTPGIRVLYLVPQSWTDASIPLSITPAPDSTVRVMMIRVEVIAPEDEAVDVQNVQMLADPATSMVAQSHFASLGRFAEPRLRRALAILQNPAYADSFLQSITTAETRIGMGE